MTKESFPWLFRNADILVVIDKKLWKVQKMNVISLFSGCGGRVGSGSKC